jgi:hypothetical protein
MKHWAVKSQWMKNWFFDIRRTRKESIEAFVNGTVNMTWRQLYRNGYRCVQVEVQEPRP